MKTWLRSWLCGHAYPGTAMAVLIWRARRSGRMFGACVGLVVIVALGGTALSLVPPADAAPLALPSAPLAVAVDDHAGRLYVAMTDARVLVLNRGDLHVIGAVDVGAPPTALAADPTSGRAYVATIHGVTVLTATAGTVGPTIDPGQPPTAIAIDPQAHRLYVTTVALDHDTASGSLADGSVVVLDTLRDAIVARVTVGVNPVALAVDTRTHRLYVAVAGDGTVDVLGGDPISVVASIPVGGMPYGVCVDPRAGRVYAADVSTATVAVLNDGSASVQETVSVGEFPAGVAVDPLSGRVFVANGGDGTVSVLGSPMGTPLTTLRVGDQPAGIALDARDGRLYVTDAGGPSIWLVEDHRFRLPTVRLFAQAPPLAVPTDGQVPPG